MDFALNISAQKKPKIKAKLDSQKISNNQKINPSFNFSWDSSKSSLQGKVFARVRNKKAAVSETNKTNKSVSLTKILETSSKSPIVTTKVIPKPTNILKKPTNIENPTATITKPIINFPKPTNNVSKSIIPRNSVNKASDLIENNSNNETEIYPQKGHIKRKQKKDKLLAKQQVKDGIQPAKFTQHDPTKTYSLFNEKDKKVHVQSQTGKSVYEKVFSEQEFSDLSIHDYVVSNLKKINYTKLTNVQAKSIPVIMERKNTLIRSQTGSGKTLAYAVPIINELQNVQPKIKRTDGVQAMIVVPTRELALQVHELFGKINTFQWIVVGHLCGGENRKSEKDRLRKGINILIGTPGRLLDHVLHTNALRIDNVRCLVLDEADRLLDMGFRKDIVSLVEALDKARTESKSDSEYNPLKMMKNSHKSNSTIDSGHESSENEDSTDVDKVERQTILLSATLTKAVSELAEFAMKGHEYIDGLDITSNALLDSFIIPETVRQLFLPTYVRHRLFTLAALLITQARANRKVFVFMASGHMVDYHHALFTHCLCSDKTPSITSTNPARKSVSREVEEFDSSDEDDEDTEDTGPKVDIQFFKLHGSMDQKLRREVFLAFRKAKTGVLICTDVAARGVDVPLADSIIQYTGPQTDEDYLHRVGRTGRAGQSGEAIIFLTHEEQDYVNHLRDHRVFLKKCEPETYIESVCELMGIENTEDACTALQRRFEDAVNKDSGLKKMAHYAYSSWSRFYNSYPSKMRTLFDFKRANQGHYVTSFALRDTPSVVAREVRGHVVDDGGGPNAQPRRLNRKLANHQDDDNSGKRRQQRPKEKRKLQNKTVSYSTSEFSSGLEPMKKRKKKE